MKIFLFGGAELGQVRRELKMIEKIINRIKPKQILHVPFARTSTHEVEWNGDWFNRNIKLKKGIRYLNASNKVNMAAAKSPLIFISGGGQNLNLVKKLKARPQLAQLIKKSTYIIGESAGAMILGKYLRVKGGDNNSTIMKGVGILDDAIIEPHYTQRNRQDLLLKEMAETGVTYGIGIDSITALELTPKEFPEKIKKIGRGKVDIKICQ
jgi:peptidase E